MLLTNELSKGLSIFRGDLASGDGAINCGSESVLSIVLPDSLEMWFLRDEFSHLMRELEILHSDNLWAEFMKGLIFLLVLKSSLLSGSVNTKNNLLVLISICERVNNFFWVVKMSSMSNPGWVWHLVVEKSA